MIKFIAYIKNNVLTDIYRECGELYSSGLGFTIMEISKEHELDGTVVSMEFKRLENFGISDSLDNVINRIFGNQFQVKLDPQSGLFKLHIGESIIAPMSFKLDDVEYL